VVLDEATSKDPVERQQYYRLTGDLLAGAKYDGAAMNRSRITDDMFACIPALLLEGMAKAEIAAMYSVTPGTLVVLVSAAYRCAEAGHCLSGPNCLSAPT
jgi:hypothetical protein